MRKTIVTAALSFISIISFAQETSPIIIGHKTVLHSKILNEERSIMVSTPDGYESGTSVYPVLYLLDGDGHFKHTVGLINFLQGVQKIPALVVVGISNTDRTRDMTPPMLLQDSTNHPASPTAGGVENFIGFLGTELMPYIESNYRTAPYRIFVGHSLGGLVAVHTLINHPDLFNAFIAISPSLWYDKQSFLPGAESFLKERKSLPVSFFMTMGDEGGPMLGGAMKLAALFEENKIEGFNWEFVPLPTETHGTIPHRSTYLGLEFIFADFKSPLPDSYEEFEEIMRNGGVQKLLSDVSEHYKQLSEKYGYAMSDENVVNQIGYMMIQEQRMEDAITAFLQNTVNYPESANTFDSLGDGYRAAGNTEKAGDSYKMAVELAEKSGHPIGPVSAEKLKELKQQ